MFLKPQETLNQVQGDEFGAQDGELGVQGEELGVQGDEFGVQGNELGGRVGSSWYELGVRRLICLRGIL